MDVGCWGFELVPKSEPIGGDEEDDRAAELGEGAGCGGGRGGEREEGEDGGDGEEGGGEEEERD